MTAAELPFEYFAGALEATHGTAVTPPTHYFPFTGMIKPVRTKRRPTYSNGLLAEFTRSKTIRTYSEFTTDDSDADPSAAPFVFNMVMKAVTSPSTPTNGVLTRLWTFSPTMTSDDLKSATLYFGDPNVKIWQAAYCMADELTISADASSEDAVTWALKGQGYFPTLVTGPSMPAQVIGDQLVPGAMQLWIDTSSAIGTTEVTGRFISTDWTIPTGVTYKHYAGGPTTSLNFTKHGRKKRSAKAKITVELNDTSIGASKEYLTYEADTVTKMRIRLNGSLIESVTPDYYYYIQMDVYGALAEFDWGDVEGSNRTMTFEVTSEYQTSPAHDFQLLVQNTKTTI